MPSIALGASKDERPRWWPSPFEARPRGEHLRVTDHYQALN
jgi:hypothetical protein